MDDRAADIISRLGLLDERMSEVAACEDWSLAALDAMALLMHTNSVSITLWTFGPGGVRAEGVIKPETVFKSLPDFMANAAALAHDHPLLEVLREKRCTAPLAISDIVGEGEFRSRAIFSELYRHSDTIDQLVVEATIGEGFLAGFVFNRDRVGFSCSERELAALAARRLVERYRMLRREASMREILNWLGGSSPDARDRCAILLDEHLRIVHATPSALSLDAGGVQGLRDGHTAPAWLSRVLARPAGPLRLRSSLVVSPDIRRHGVSGLPGDTVCLFTFPDVQEQARTVLVERGLTPRQVQIVELVAQGCTTKMIAQQLEISLSTVKSHLEIIYSRLDVENRSGAIARYLSFRES